MKEGPRHKRSKRRESLSLTHHSTSDPINVSANTAEVPQTRSVSPPCLVAVTGEQLLNDVMVNELPTTTTEDTSADNSSSNTDPVIHAALLARIEMLEAENKSLKSN